MSQSAKWVKFAFLPTGALFGFVLSRAGATTYDYYAELFLFRDLQLMWVIAAGAATGAVGFALLRTAKSKGAIERAALGRKSLNFDGKPYRKTLIIGSLIFGIGWGAGGACPGTGLAMIGEGKFATLFNLVGIVVGTYLYGLWQSGNTEPDKRNAH